MSSNKASYQLSCQNYDSIVKQDAQAYVQTMNAGVVAGNSDQNGTETRM